MTKKPKATARVRTVPVAQRLTAAEGQARVMMEKLRGEPGQLSRIAQALGVYPQAVHQWKMVPLDRVVEVERITGIPREKLRPDYHLPRATKSDCPAVHERVAAE